MRRGRMGKVSVASLVLALGLVGCTPKDGVKENDDPGKGPSGEPVKLTVAVQGHPQEIAAFREVVSTYNDMQDDATVTVRAQKPDQKGPADPDGADVFMASRSQLDGLLDSGLSQPVGDLLDKRNVQFSDNFQRDAVQAFSVDQGLQCMPWSASPMVIFYNRALIDFDRMRKQDRFSTPSSHLKWTFNQFSDTAEFATRPRRGVKGLSIAPTLEALAPFLYAGGGKLFDDDKQPTSLVLSDEDSRAALDKVMPLLRNPHLTPSPERLKKTDAVQLFKQGKVAMIAGYRDLVPELRKVRGLDFDVMAMPTLDEAATVGDFTGMCLAADPTDTEEAADLLAYLVSPKGVAPVAEKGYMVPANVVVAESEAFTKKDQNPNHANVFTYSMRNIVTNPLVEDWPAVTEAVAPQVTRMFNAPVVDIESITQVIDERSRTVLDPEASPSESGSGSAAPSGSGTPSASGSGGN